MEISTVFLTLGGLFLAGLAADIVGRRTRLPRVTLLLGLGLLAGRSGLSLIPPQFEEAFGFLSVAALTLVAFLLGNALTRDKLASNGRMILAVSASIVGITLVVVTAGLAAIGLPLALALVLAAIATATAPAATQDTIREARAKGPFAETVLGVVAIDDVWGIIVFSLVLVVAAALTGASENGHVLLAARDIFGALGVGLVVGLPGAALSGRLNPGEPLQAEALGLVCLTAGLCSWLDVSHLLAGLTAGAVIANAARHHERAFHEIELIEWPFMILFFLMAGALLEVSHLWALGGVGAAYVGLRIIARLGGGWVGATWAGSSGAERMWIGPALLPQAGVAVGMALVAAESLPQWGPQIMTLTVGTTVIFELLGPPITRIALKRAGAIPAEPARSPTGPDSAD